MKYILLLMIFGMSLFAFAQSSPAVAPVAAVVAVAAPAAPVVSGGLIAIVGAIVIGLNLLLSSIQKVFSTMAKTEPGWLQSLSAIVLAVAKFLGSNPSV